MTSPTGDGRGSELSRTRLAGNRFTIVRRLGAGGMGVVYEALDRDSGSAVALKTLTHITPDALYRFKKEFRAHHELHHPNLVSLGELIAEGDEWFLTMELVRGCDFLRYVRRDARVDVPDPVSPSADTLQAMRVGASASSGTFDLQRLRDALRQLAIGVSALHRAGTIHRDIKPSNVLVDGAGRVVIVDFGLATPDRDARFESTQNFVGTAAYMAPEQAGSEGVGPEADWYAVGVMLYEALTGRLPFDGTAFEVLLAKRSQDPVPPNELAPDVPDDLSSLCRALLCRAPSQRAGLDEIMAVVGIREPATRPSQRASTEPGAQVFGRDDELRLLSDAAAQSRAGQLVTVLLEGEAGVGKTTVVRRFLDLLTRQHPDVVVLAGRCYERESVPYKAFDGILDALTRELMHAPLAEAAAMVPVMGSLLAQVFPVLCRVEAFANAPSLARVAAEPHEQRRRLFEAVRELFVRLSERRAVVIAIDDMQWADAESLALLRVLGRAPDAPACLIVMTARGGLNIDDTLPDVRHIRLRPLASADARQYAQTLLQDVSASADVAVAIADEAAGHPLFIDALARYVTSTRDAVIANVRLEDVLWQRIEGLPPSAGALLEVVAVAGEPIRQHVAVKAADLATADVAAALNALRSTSLIKTDGARADDRIEVFHDRIRETIVARVAADVIRDRHARVAAALETCDDSKPEVLALHWQAAGQPKRAAEYARNAGAAAAAALAFDKAVRFYRAALEMGDYDAQQRRSLTIRLAEALAAAGRGAEAAHEFFAAASDLSAEEALPLRQRAMEYLLKSGDLERGLSVVRDVLSAVGLSYPETLRSSIWSLLRNRAYIAVRGISWTEPREQPSTLEQTKLDACLSVSQGLALIDLIRAADFQARHLRRALRHGDRERVIVALLNEAAFAAIMGDERRYAFVFSKASALAGDTQDSYLVGMSAYCECVAAFNFGRWPKSYACCETALRLLPETGRAVAHETTILRLFKGWDLCMLGRLAEVLDHMPRWLDDARERGDRLAESCLAGTVLSLAWLAKGDVEVVREAVNGAVREWRIPGYQFQHWWWAQSNLFASFYAGDATAAYDEIERAWPQLSASRLLRCLPVRIQALESRAQAALLLAGHDRAQAAQQLQRARRFAKRLALQPATYAKSGAQLLDAQLAFVHGRTDEAIAHLRACVRSFDELSMELHAAVSRLELGKLIGGDEGDAMRADAETWMRGQQIANSSRMAATLAPGFYPA